MVKFKMYSEQRPTAQIFAYDEKQSKHPVGWAMVALHGPESASIINILVHEPYRRRGYGKALIERLQGVFNKIDSDFTSATINSAGNMLCLKMGFEPQPTAIKGVGKLVWKKEKKDEPK